MALYKNISEYLNKQLDINNSIKCLQDILKNIDTDWNDFKSLNFIDKLDWLIGDAFGWSNGKDSRYAWAEFTKTNEFVQFRISNHKQEGLKYIKINQQRFPTDYITDIRIYDRNSNKAKSFISEQTNSSKSITVDITDDNGNIKKHTFNYEARIIDSIHLDNLDDVKKLLDALIDCLKNIGKFVHPFTKKVVKESLSLTEYIKLNTYITEHLLCG